MRCEHIQLMARYNQWMNTRLYEAARGLPDADLKADRGAYFQSLFGTLNHLAVADTIWLRRFATHPARYPALEAVRDLPVPAALDQLLFHDLVPLNDYRFRVDALILAWAGEIREPELDHVLRYANSKGVVSDKSFFSLLMHFFNHQTHHRGQASTLLLQAGIDLGVTDLLALIPNKPATPDSQNRT